MSEKVTINKAGSTVDMTSSNDAGLGKQQWCIVLAKTLTSDHLFMFQFTVIKVLLSLFACKFFHDVLENATNIYQFLEELQNTGFICI